MEGEPSIWFEILIILILVFANGIFAMTEIAIVSSRKARLEKHAVVEIIGPFHVAHDNARRNATSASCRT